MTKRIDDLQLDGLKIMQEEGGYGFTSDAVLLANFVKTKKSDICAEIGTGSGVISILVNYKEKPKKIYAFEIQPNVAKLAKENIKLNKMQKNIEILPQKVQNWRDFIDFGSVDVVFCNPPYFKYDNNVCGKNEIKQASRFDKYLPLCELFDCCSKMLKSGGKMFFVYSSSRLFECFYEMKKVHLAPKRMYFVHPNLSKDSTVFLCEAVKDGKDGVIIMPPLFTNNLDGDYIQTIQKLYKGE